MGGWMDDVVYGFVWSRCCAVSFLSLPPVVCGVCWRVLIVEWLVTGTCWWLDGVELGLRLRVELFAVTCDVCGGVSLLVLGVMADAWWVVWCSLVLLVHAVLQSSLVRPCCVVERVVRLGVMISAVIRWECWWNAHRL